MSTNKKLIAVYGSLRKGEYNYEGFKARFGSEFEYQKTQKIEGFSLFSLGSYPGVHRKEGTPLTIDLIECSQECFERINSMEVGAGYQPIEVDTEAGPAVLYLYKGSPRGGFVNSGDWTKRSGTSVQF